MRLMENRRCESCGAPLISKTIGTYQDELLGIEKVLLLNSVENLACPHCPGVSYNLVPDIPGLIAAAAVARITISGKLTGKDIRFLRKAISLTSKELANRLGVTEEAVSRWENDKQPIGPASEKLLRLFVGFQLRDKAPGVDFDESKIASMTISSLNHTQPVIMAFERIAMKIDKKREKAWMPEEVAA